MNNGEELCTLYSLKTQGNRLCTLGHVVTRVVSRTSKWTVNDLNIVMNGLKSDDSVILTKRISISLHSKTQLKAFKPTVNRRTGYFVALPRYRIHGQDAGVEALHKAW